MAEKEDQIMHQSVALHQIYIMYWIHLQIYLHNRHQSDSFGL